jgi:hypothetical protein
MHVALHRPIAAGRVRVEPAARWDGALRGLLHCLHGAIVGRVDDNSPLTTDPRDARWPVVVSMAPPGVAFLTAPTRATPQVLCPSVCGLSLVARGLVEVIGFTGACQLALHRIGHSGMAPPPAPPIARADMDPYVPGQKSFYMLSYYLPLQARNRACSPS